MKRALLVLSFVLTMGLVFYPVQGIAHMGGYGSGYGGGYGMGPGMMGPGYGGYGPGYGMGPGMMGPGYGYGPGYGMGPGMMGPGYGYGMPGYGPQQYGPQYQQPQKPLDKEDARAIMEGYLNSTRNPNLKLGKIMEKGNGYEAEITTKDGSLVDKVMVDKYTGWMRSIY